MPRLARDATTTPQRAVARAFLLHHLRPGEEQSAGVLIEAAQVAGIHVRTLRRAARDLGVIVERSSGGDGIEWRWRLPATAYRAEVDRVWVAILALPPEARAELRRRLLLL